MVLTSNGNHKYAGCKVPALDQADIFGHPCGVVRCRDSRGTSFTMQIDVKDAARLIEELPDRLLRLLGRIGPGAV
jgi:hypothetical protein